MSIDLFVYEPTLSEFKQAVGKEADMLAKFTVQVEPVSYSINLQAKSSTSLNTYPRLTGYVITEAKRDCS